MALLESNGHSPVVVEYLKTPPSADQIRTLLAQLELQPIQLMRKGETIFKELGLGDEGVSDEQRIAAMAEHPILIERPIVVSGGKAAIGRPPESVLTIL
ncbi:MAG: arsenate reductase [Lysobacteraceae bacterium]|nr:MAG: arsenate reductase [Xanthomonadaceae bacterium]